MDHIGVFLEEFTAAHPECEIRKDELMSAHTTFRVGGPARAVILPKTEEQLVSAVSTCRKENVPYIIAGNGSNLLFSDRNHEIVVIKTSGLSEISVSGEMITAGAGALLSKIAAAALESSLAGFEFAHGIPGSLGGAVFMNAGAYGGEMKDVIVSVRALCDDITVREFTNEECGFSYRESRFEKGGIVLSAKIKLSSGDKNAIKELMADLAVRRRDKQPLNFPSAGSTFKRPKNGFAAAMIDEAGLKGFTVGNAQVSEKHAGFVVNLGGASFEDVLAVIEHVKKAVYERTGTELSPEVKIIP